ncbi:16S rRNA (cytosine967-C5)-methyltransferase [Leucobacter luti]|uniref:RsmB/NOP family class I SAM-dependent RNA methyltransferase n=1 Tax=Leucobacter luti TaxID=340320 RepID=UPI0010E76569|nr:transcription antitermination factor NusB [Leucobacter luti]MCW2287603.1 16S rRNA (cytosine967-C5)-methyltransferase [Leucobacter luti]TCK46229.1 16S rRNA (cytosine967-C5)-methyltransferase [Leucobacter luti]
MSGADRENREERGRGEQGRTQQGRGGNAQGDTGGRARGAASRRGTGRGSQGRPAQEQRRAQRPRISAPRLVAYDVLRDVEERESYANLALPSRIRDANLDGRDAGLATELVAGALRWRGRYDRIIELAAGRAIDEIDSRTRNVLRLGVHQVLGMRTAAHAAVNESVELQRRVGNQNAAGFVNGVLRTVGRSTNEEWDAAITAEARTPDEALAARTSHPAWVLRALRDALRYEGRDAELEDLLAADNDAPRVSLAVLPGSERTPAEAASAMAQSDGAVADAPEEEPLNGPSLSAAGSSPLGLELSGGDPARAIAAIGEPEGLVRVQDQGSQLAALALTRVRPVRSGEHWLDLCAGPGGKTAVLGAEAILGGARVRANEVSEHRAELVRRSVAAVADAVEVVSYDGRDAAAYGDELFDRILVDAPCTGLGALRRRPEARWRKQPSDLPGLTVLQAELLDAAAARLVRGGILAYVTCSPHLAETRIAVDRLLARTPELTELDARAVLRTVARGELDVAGEALSAQLWPHRHGTDAMFVALFQRS